MNDNEIKSVAIIGGGVSGLTVARLLRERYRVTVFDANPTPGGLIRCQRVEGSLFHTCGGHVFNTRRSEVLDFFGKIFDYEREFRKSDRNSVIFMADGLRVPYPIENYAYLFDDETLRRIIADVVALKSKPQSSSNFEEFLQGRFGSTLYNLYFRPYNEKIWRRRLNDVPIEWLEGKLPMPSPEEIIYNNIRRVAEKQFVHSTFWYERQGGSQYLADRLAEGTDIRYSSPVNAISRQADGRWAVAGELFDAVVYTGNIRRLPSIVEGLDLSGFAPDLERLESHGTTSVFCEIDQNPYSWIYLPDHDYDAHRIICTGNFAPSNNASPRLTATVEFTDRVDRDEIERQLERIPLNPRYLAHCYNEVTYPIQTAGTREMIRRLKQTTQPAGLWLTGRFADWEYYNMDAAMEAAINTVKTFDR